MEIDQGSSSPAATPANPQLTAQCARLVLGQAIAVLALIDRLSGERRPQIRFVRWRIACIGVTMAIPSCWVIWLQVLVVQHIHGWHAAAFRALVATSVLRSTL